MNYKETTMVPNKVFQLFNNPKLSPSNILVLLIIIRQTIGWYDPKTKKRKKRDWITYQLFKKKTGLSIKTVSQSINILIQEKIIKATDVSGRELCSAELRKGKVRIYYQCLLVDRQKSSRTYVKKYRYHRKKIPITKLTPTKLTQQKGIRIRRQTDKERLEEILAIKQQENY